MNHPFSQHFVDWKYSRCVQVADPGRSGFGNAMRSHRRLSISSQRTYRETLPYNTQQVSSISIAPAGGVAEALRDGSIVREAGNDGGMR
jgi:hypothetical protein